MMKYAVLAAGLSALTTPVFAQSGGECGLQADIVMQVVGARQDGQDAGAALNAVAEGLSGDAAKYAPVVPAIAEWVYSLPEDQLGDAVGESWRTQCENM